LLSAAMYSMTSQSVFCAFPLGIDTPPFSGHGG
jgi:hypothetical protein